MSSQKNSQQRVEQIHSFSSELKNLEEEGILSLSKTQTDEVKSYHDKLLEGYSKKYDIDLSKSDKQLSLGMKIASFLAALALSFSIFFLFLQFWGGFSVSLQIFVLISTPTLLLGSTYLLSRKQSNDYYTKILALLSLVSFVLNLSMLGEIFNIASSPNAFLVWSIFGLLLAYGLCSRLLLGFGIIFFSFYMSAKVGVFGGGYWINFSDRPENFFAVAFVLFFVSFLRHSKEHSFDVVYRYFAMFLFFIPVLILSNYAEASYFNMDRDFTEGMYQMIGFSMSALAIFVGIKKSHTELINTGNVFFVIFLYTKLFNWWWDYMPKYLFFLVIGLSAFLLLSVLKRLRS